jgi:hypothetical protein
MGIPAVFLIMPPDIPKKKEGEYFYTADQVVSQARRLSNKQKSGEIHGSPHRKLAQPLRCAR